MSLTILVTGALGQIGGPLLLISKRVLGPTDPSNSVIGVNAYYTFKGGSGVSMRNTHTRLYDNPDNGKVFTWLTGILPASSFVYVN